jgi:hypothetical protein
MKMPQTLQAKNIGLDVLRDSFRLQYVADESFFPEWRDCLIEVTIQEKGQLDQIQAGYLNQIQSPPLLEKTIQIIVISPLLFIAGLYLSPFHIHAEKSIKISSDDDGKIIKGCLDILLLRDGFWAMVIESKRASFSIEAGLAQMLAYMMAAPHPDQPCYGLIASGSDFIFIKLTQNETGPKYSTSDQFGMRRSGDLYQVFRILKGLAQS